MSIPTLQGTKLYTLQKKYSMTNTKSFHAKLKRLMLGRRGGRRRRWEGRYKLSHFPIHIEQSRKKSRQIKRGEEREGDREDD
jgi:hypothetical protein